MSVFSGDELHDDDTTSGTDWAVWQTGLDVQCDECGAPAGSPCASWCPVRDADL